MGAEFNCSKDRELTDGTRLEHLVAGCVEIALACVIFALLHYNTRAARHGNKHAAQMLVLPAYTFVMYYVAFVDLVFGIFSVLNFYADSPIVLAARWAAWRTATEGLAFFFLHQSVGLKPMVQSLALGLFWALLSGALEFNVQINMALEISVGVVFVFYMVLWLAPMKRLQRRPAVIPYSRYCAILMGSVLVMNTLVLVSNRDEHNCGNLILLAFADIIQPFIIYRALLDDSEYWQGFYSQPQFNLNSPLLGMWEVGRETVELLSEAMADLQQNPVPIIHFGLLTIDTSMFFPGGHARVYKGWYKEEQVAIKILFCIELTSSSILEFCEEATVLHSLKHPNIVSCKGVCIMPPAISLVTEFCEYGSLFDFLHKTNAEQTNKIRRRAWRISTRIARRTSTGYVDVADPEEQNEDRKPGALKSVSAFFRETMLTLAWSSKRKTVVTQSLRRSSVGHSSGHSRPKLFTASGSNISVDSLRAAWSNRSGQDLQSIPEDDSVLRTRSLSGVGLSRESKSLLGRRSAPIIERSTRNLSTQSEKAVAAAAAAAPKRVSWVNDVPFLIRLRMAVECTRGLAFLHSKNLMHCDVKSLNYLVTKDLHIKLADLGEVRPVTARGSNSAVPMFPVSFNWAPPEILYDRRHDVCAKSDVWALGMVLYEVFTGEIPFETPEVNFLTYDEFIEGVLRGVIRPTLPADLPEWLVKLLYRCWSSEIDHRPTSSEVLEVLEDHFARACGAPQPQATDSTFGSVV